MVVVVVMLQEPRKPMVLIPKISVMEMMVLQVEYQRAVVQFLSQMTYQRHVRLEHLRLIYRLFGNQMRLSFPYRIRVHRTQDKRRNHQEQKRRMLNISSKLSPVL